MGGEFVVQCLVSVAACVFLDVVFFVGQDFVGLFFYEVKGIGVGKMNLRRLLLSGVAFLFLFFIFQLLWLNGWAGVAEKVFVVPTLFVIFLSILSPIVLLVYGVKINLVINVAYIVGTSSFSYLLVLVFLLIIAEPLGPISDPVFFLILCGIIFFGLILETLLWMLKFRRYGWQLLAYLNVGVLVCLVLSVGIVFLKRWLIL